MYLAIIFSRFFSYIHIFREDVMRRIDVDVLFDGRSIPGIKSNQTYMCVCVYVCAVGFPKLYPAIPMQFGSNVMTVSPSQSSQLGRHIWGGHEGG